MCVVDDDFDVEKEVEKMKECNLNCALQHEGYCSWDMGECTAKTNDDLMTEEEYDKGESHGNVRR